MKDMIGKLDEELVAKASGGVIFNASNIDGADKNNPWEVLDDNIGGKDVREIAYINNAS